MTNQDPIKALLEAPFSAIEIHWRTAGEKGDRVRLLAYLDARAVQRRLDEVFGVFGWQSRAIQMGSKIIGCELLVNGNDNPKNEPLWIRKSDVSDVTDIEPGKGAYSTAFKRAAASGLGIGRYLYDLGETLTDIVEWGMGTHSFKRKSGQWANYTPPVLPSRMVPQDEQGADQPPPGSASVDQGPTPAAQPPGGSQDSGPMTAAAEAVAVPNCECGIPATSFTSKKPQSVGRRFFCCAKERMDASRCDFFEWAK